MKKIKLSSSKKISQSFFRFFSAVLITAILAIAHASASTFSDVDDSQIYSTGINFLTQNGIVKGYGNGTFKPSNALNRAELLKIIAEGSAKYSNQDSSIFANYSGKKCFNDVPANQWYTKYVCYAKENSWVIGYEKSKIFKPDQKITFVEALKMTFKGFNLKFNETDSAPWYHDLVDQASAHNFIPFDMTGFSVNLRRDQMADLATRIIKANESLKSLNNYLGDRTDIVVTYETLKQGLDLSKLQVETK
ncbi:S-layer homology domain-containing protein [Candidatus Peregrinibacteria bacterium]|nr:S-layer homology domain-containing protein [Candidatus Peregrinibacteria bacterium]